MATIKSLVKLSKYHCYKCGAPVHHKTYKSNRATKRLYERQPNEIYCQRHAWIWRNKLRSQQSAGKI